MNAPYVNAKQTTYLVGDYGVSVMEVLDTVCDQLQQDDKHLAPFIQVFIVPLLSMCWH